MMCISKWWAFFWPSLWLLQFLVTMYLLTLLTLLKR